MKEPSKIAYYKESGELWTIADIDKLNDALGLDRTGYNITPEAKYVYDIPGNINPKLNTWSAQTPKYTDGRYTYLSWEYTIGIRTKLQTYSIKEYK